MTYYTYAMMVTGSRTAFVGPRISHTKKQAARDRNELIRNGKDMKAITYCSNNTIKVQTRTAPVN